MNRSAPSINAVLANERYHAERQQKAPESPISPTSPAPSFSWPRRVRSPEPHVPLRKASPERLHQRTKKPPLFVTTNAGNHGLGPTTASSVAVPHQTRADAAHKDWWEDIESTHNYNHDSDQNHNHNHNQKNNNYYYHHSLGNNQRKLSAVDHTSPIRQRQLSAADATRKGSWPLPPPLNDRFGDRNASTISIPESTPEELMRTSYRSAMTSSSSHMDSTVATTRSSVATADSSVSDIVKIDSSWTDEHNQGEDDDFTVEDALDMYLGGFGTPNKLSVDIRSSIDSRRGSYPRSSLDTSHLRPGTSPLKHGSDLNRLHRRSHSAGVIDRKSILIDINAANPSNTLNTLNTSNPANPTNPIKAPSPLHLDIKPVLNYTRTSTDIITGRDLPNSRPPSAPINVPRDRYGFKKMSQHITVEQYDAWEKPYNEHLERRRVKWNGLMKQFGYTTENPSRFPTKSEKVKRYIRKGIPPDWRGAAWFWYAGGPGKLAKDPELYWNLLQDVRDGKLSDNDREHIERDLHRTFPDNIRFKPDPGTGANPEYSGNPEDEPSMIKALRRLLQTFAVHNPNIGYCQSLNFIAGLLLLFLDEDEEKAFVLLNVVTTQHLPGTHGVALEGANIDIQVLMTSIKESLPSTWQKLDDKPTTPGPGGAPRLPTVSLATTAWFMSLFVGTLPIECVLRVWDCLFFEGSKTLFRVALAIFKSGEQKIKSVNDPMEIFQVVQTMPRGMLDANALMECCFKKRGGFGGLSQDVVEKRRKEGREATRQGRSLTDDIGKKGLIRGKSRGRFGIKTKSAVH